MGLSELVLNLTVCGLLLGGALTEVDDDDEDEGPNAPVYDYLDSESTPDSTTYATEKPVTPEDPDCPPGKSYISHSDIRAAIDDLSSEFEKEYITKLLPRYEQMRESFKQEFVNFKTFIIYQPTRLKSVLENIARQREGMEPDMDFLVNALRRYSIYNKQYDMLLQEKIYILKNYERYRKNCPHSCEEDEKTARFISTVAYPPRDGDTCISMQDLFRYIKQQLAESTAQLSHMADMKYQNIENDYRRKLDDVKGKLKQSALEAFGKPMFDVLSLQDELYQFTHNFELENLESILYEISANILNTGIKLNVLNRKVKDYGMRCKNQNSRDLFDGDKCTISAYPTETRHDTKIIDELVQEKFHDIEESVTSKYELILKDLDVAMKDTEVRGIFSVIHPDVDDEIRELIQREQQAFGQLQRRVPDAVLKQFNILLQKTQEPL